ncbi:MAG TPA: class I SAM-dependent methyltransferase [Euzebyales bacterium]|nr:class I SAM-dependent methyltransferase [Euzebyales bacterium]
MDPRTQESIAAFDRAAEKYHEVWKERRPLDAVRTFGALAGRGARVLDVASGPALDVRVLRDQGLFVVAGDRGEETMRIGHMLFPTRPLARWDFRRLPVAAGTFGGIWAPAALQHLPRREMRSALGELRRVHGRGPIFVSFREGSGDLDLVDEPGVGAVYVTTVTPVELKTLLLDQGYSQVEIQHRPDPLGRTDITWVYGWGRC